MTMMMTSTRTTGTSAIFSAASVGNMAGMAFLHEQGCPWELGVCDAAALGGHLSCLRYTHEHGAPWDASVCLAAASGGHLACLEYARVHGCPWGDVHACLAAAKKKTGADDVCKWIERQIACAAVAQAMFDRAAE